MRQDLGLLRPGDEVAVDLRILTGRRLDLVNDRTRQINRLREQLLGIFPALERALTRKGRGLVVLLTGYQTPGTIRRIGARRLESWLKNRGVKSASSLARTAVEAAEAQHTALPGEKLAADMVARIAKGVLALDAEITELDALIEARFHDHPHAKVIETLPGMGPRLGAEFIAATGGDLTAFGPRTGWRASPDWPRSHAIPVASEATCTGPAATTAACCGPATSPRWPASAAALSPSTTTSANATRGKATSRPCWPWPADVSTSAGP